MAHTNSSKTGRPSEYTEEKGNLIVEAIASGGLITRICKQPEFPDYTTFRRWRDAQPEFAKRIAHARKDQAEHYRDEITELNESMDRENWQYVNARIRNTQWLLGKLHAAQYGDKVDMNLGGQAGNPIQAAIAVTFVGTGSKTKDLDAGG